MIDNFIYQERKYQTNDLAAIEKAFEEYLAVLYQLPTGGGKSVVTMNFIEKRKDKNIIVFAHKRKLLTTLRRHFASKKIRVGYLQGQNEENINANIIIVSIRTAVKDARLAELLKRNWDYCIVDEARHSRTSSYDTVLDALKEAHPQMKLLGVDATPYRKDRKRLDKHFQHMVVSEENVATLTEKKFLQRCKVIVSPIDKEALRESVKEVANDYQMTELSNYMRQEKFLDYVVEQYRTYGEERQCIVFAVDKAHARDLAARFKVGGYTKVAQIDSDLGQAAVDTAFDDFEEGKIQVLINIEMATEGVDLPTAGCIIGARPTRSLTLYLQMGGRGTRPDGVHDYFILLDCCGWTDEFGTLSSPKHWSLNPEIDPNNPRKKNKVVGVRKDGTFTEDLTDFIGEVIEMDPDQYMTHLVGGLESAQEMNLTIDEKIKIILNDLQALLIKYIKASWSDKFEARIQYDNRKKRVLFVYKNDGTNNDEDRWDYRKKTVIPLDEESALYAYCPHDGYGGMNRKSSELRAYMELSQLAGDFNKYILGNKNAQQQAREIIEQVDDLEKNKINLDKFKRAADTFKEEQWEKKVRAHIKEHGEITFPHELSESSYFKGGDYFNKIIGIKIPSGNIVGHHNKIVLMMKAESRYSRVSDPRLYEEAKNYVKGEKVLELIKDGECFKEEEATNEN